MGKNLSLDHKMYVLDTNVLLHEPLAFLSFQEHDVIIPMTVLEELDHIKDRKKDVSRDARVAIRALDDVLRDATPEQMLAGVDLPKVSNDDDQRAGKLTIVNDHLYEDTVSGLPGNENDHRIINCAVYLQGKYQNEKVVLVTKDINMRLKAKGAGLEYVEDYRTDQLIDDISLLSSGYKRLDGDFWQQVKECESVQVGRETYHTIPRALVDDVFINEYLLDETGHFAARVESFDDEHIKLLDLGVEARCS